MKIQFYSSCYKKMKGSTMQEILKSNYEKYKSFLDKKRFSLDPDWEDYYQLNNALQCKQKELAKLLIIGGARVNKNLEAPRYCYLRTPLHLAVNLGCPEIVKMLLDCRACINTKDENGESPLTLAAKTKKSHIVDLMLPLAVRKNRCNRKKLSHLHVACMRNQVDVVKKLIQIDAQVNNSVDEKSLFWPGFTPLHFAVEFQCYETVEFLLNCGAKIVVKDASGLTPLHRAHMIQDESIIDLILSFHMNDLTNPVNPQGLSHFHIACTRNEPRIVENFIKWGADINAVVTFDNLHWYGYRPINYAIDYGCVDVVKLLLAYNINLDIMMSDGNPIRNAHRMANQEITDLLLSNMNIQKVDDSKMTHGEQDDDSIEDKLLILHTANPLNDTCKNQLYLTPLHLAIKNKCTKATKVLLAWDKTYAVTKATCIKNKTPLHLAFESKQEEVVDLILSTYKFFDEDVSDDSGLSHFHIACTRNKPEIVERFLQNLVDVDRQVRMDSEFHPGCTALHLAIKFKALDVVRLLLKYRADVTLKNGQDLTPLDQAILGMTVSYPKEDKVQNLSVVDAILSYASSVDAIIDDRGFTRLHMAIAKNDASAVEQFLNLHPDVVNKPINWAACKWHGWTLLHFAIDFDSGEAAGLLVRRGANLCAKNAEGNTPSHTLDYWRQYRELGIKWYKTDENPVSECGLSHFHMACRVDDLEAVQHFLDLGVDFNLPVKFTDFGEHVGQTPLHLACIGYNRSKFSAVQLLLDRGAEINARDIVLNTPLHCSMESDTAVSTRILLSRGADVAARNVYSMTPLLSACHVSMPEDKETCIQIELLLDYGADINAIADDGRTPFSHLKDLIGYYESVPLAVIMKHVKKLQLIGHHISKKTQSEYKALAESIGEEDDVWYDEGAHVQQCLEELERMASVKLNSYTTLRDILHKNLNGLAAYSKNSSLRKLVESLESLKQEYPIYGYLLRLQFRKGLERRPLLEQAETALNRLMGLRSSVPVDCLERILRGANNDDLRNVIDAVNVV